MPAAPEHDEDEERAERLAEQALPVGLTLPPTGIATSAPLAAKVAHAFPELRRRSEDRESCAADGPSPSPSLTQHPTCTMVSKS